jgi:hypothetical protein
MKKATPAPAPKTMSIPEAGWAYYGLARNGSYRASERGEIPYILVGRLKRVPIAAMERRLEQSEIKERTSAPDADDR